MRKYNSENQLTEVICNCCGKTIKIENEIIKEGCFHVDSVWGYFSRRDGERHRFDLCEDCYDRMISAFSIPAEIAEETELV